MPSSPRPLARPRYAPQCFNRLGRHQLQSSLAVRERGRDQSGTRDYACKFCNLNVDETAEHALMECQGHVDEREFFLARMDEIAPEFRRIRQEEKMKILMADEIK